MRLQTLHSVLAVFFILIPALAGAGENLTGRIVGISRGEGVARFQALVPGPDGKLKESGRPFTLRLPADNGTGCRGRLPRTGDVVRISGAFSPQEEGVFLVERLRPARCAADPTGVRRRLGHGCWSSSRPRGSIQDGNEDHGGCGWRGRCRAGSGRSGGGGGGGGRR